MNPEQPSQVLPKNHVAVLFSTPEPPMNAKRLMGALREAGLDVTPCALAPQKDSDSDLFSDLRTSVAQLTQSLTGTQPAAHRPPDWLLTSMKEQVQNIDAVVTLNAKVAKLVFPVVRTLWPDALRIGIAGTYNISSDWGAVTMDDMIVPHRATSDRIQFHHGTSPRFTIAGPLAGGSTIKPRSLEEQGQTVVVSFQGLDEGDVDPLLFQLSMAVQDGPSLLFLPTGIQHIDELVKVKASQYGLRGKRPRITSDNEDWIAGATALVGLPSSTELTQAMAWHVPTVLFTNGKTKEFCHDFALQQGTVIDSTLALTLSVDIESVLPGGRHREPLQTAMQNLEGIMPKRHFKIRNVPNLPHCPD